MHRFAYIVLMFLALPLLATRALAEEPLDRVVYFDVPGQALSSALVEFALQTEIDFIVSAKMLEGYQSSPLVGHFRISEALTFLFSRSPFEYQYTPQGVTVRNVSKPPVALNQNNTVKQERISEEVVEVTSRRRQESIMDVPLSVTSQSGQQIEQLGIRDFFQFGLNTPNIVIKEIRGTSSSVTAYIRGIGQEDPVAGLESGVGIYVDDVYINRPQSMLAEIVDPKRIEILRGPQGTLYGRNTLGGAIKYETHPLPEEPSAQVSLSIGDARQHDAVIKASTPIIDQRWSIGGTVGLFNRDGYGKNTTTGEENYNKDIQAYRLRSEWFSDNFSSALILDRSYDRSNPVYGRSLFGEDEATNNNNAFDSSAGIRLSNHPMKNFSIDTQGSSLDLQWTASEKLTLRSIHSTREDETHTPIDMDGVEQPIVDTYALYKNDQISHELQASYKNDIISSVTGAYYLKSNAFNAYDVVLINLQGLQFTSGDISTTSKAVFSDIEITTNENWRISLGIRYTEDEKEALIERSDYLASEGADFISPYFGGQDLTSVTPLTFDEQGREVSPRFSGKRKDTIITPRAGLSWKPSKHALIYTSYSRGFRAGGFDPRGSYRFEVFRQGYDPEIVDSYELGFKKDYGESKHRLSTALFLSRYQDVQVNTGFITQSEGEFIFVEQYTNSADAKMKGFEIELESHLGTHWDSRFHLGWVNANYDSFRMEPFGDIAHERVFINTPKLSTGLALDYHTPLSSGDLTVTVAYNYVSKVHLVFIPSDPLIQDGYGIADFSAIWRKPDDAFSLGLHVTNLFDERYKTSAYNFQGFNAQSVYHGAPRRIVGSIKMKF